MKKLNVEPFGDRVLVKQDEPQKDKKIGAIIMADASNRAPNHGTIVAVGSGRIIGEKLKLGWRVIFSPHSGVEIDVDGEKYFVLEEGGILAVFTS